MSRLLLLLPTAAYRARDFLDAAAALGAEVVVACERRQALGGVMGERALRVSLRCPEAAAQAIVALAERTPLDAVLAVDDQGVLVAALAAERLGLAHNPSEAVAAARDKAAMRRAFAAAGLPQPEYRIAGPRADVALLAAEVCRRPQQPERTGKDRSQPFHAMALVQTPPRRHLQAAPRRRPHPHTSPLDR